MSSVNKVILVGRLGRDPELRYAPSGAAIANLSLATSRSWKDKHSGEKVEETEWHRLVAYDRLAEVIGEYLKKGQNCYFEGRMKTRKWDDKDGVSRFTTEVIVDQMVMLGGRDGGDAAPSDARPAPSPAPAPRGQYGGGPAYPPPPLAAPRPPPPAQRQSTSFDDMDDDIPF